MMNRFLWFCLHQWEELYRVSLVEKESDKIPVGVKFVSHRLVCPTCYVVLYYFYMI